MYKVIKRDGKIADFALKGAPPPSGQNHAGGCDMTATLSAASGKASGGGTGRESGAQHGKERVIQLLPVPQNDQ